MCYTFDMKKHTLVFMLIFTFVVSFSLTSKLYAGSFFDTDPPNQIFLQVDCPYMTYNEVTQEIDPGRGTKPVIFPEQKRCYVPLSPLIQIMQGTCSWDSKYKAIAITVQKVSIKIRINSPKAYVKNQWNWIDRENRQVAPVILNDRTMVPLRFIAESLGCCVEWDPEHQIIAIKY